MTELKPCPFCGGKARLFVNGGVRVICSKCGVSTKILTDKLECSSRVMHQMIDDLARALTEKRKCEGNGDGQNRDLQPGHRRSAAKDGR